MHTTHLSHARGCPALGDALLVSCRCGVSLKLTYLLLGLLCVIGIVSGRRDARILVHVTSDRPVNNQINHADRQLASRSFEGRSRWSQRHCPNDSRFEWVPQNLKDF